MESRISKLLPRGTNSTFFTDCCRTAICDNERRCPRCDNLVIGHDADTDYQRRLIRWRDATDLWSKR